MLWRGQRESSNVIDRRSFGAGGLGIGGLLIGAFIYFLMGGNPLVYLAQNADTIQSATTRAAPDDDDKKQFASVVLADTEDVWSSQLENYSPPKMVLFRGVTDTACGRGTRAAGPFYCPNDQMVYLDLSFFDDLSNKLGAGGDFAAAYVIAHEVGHHVQTLLGLTSTRATSVQFELQADCLAGVWARQTQNQKNILEHGDLEEALIAAAAVGDDRIQKMTTGEVVPDSFTHGTSAQRASAFQKGYAGGEIRSCVQ